MNINELIVEDVKKLVFDLVNANFGNIENSGRNGRLSIGEIKDAITEYKGNLTIPPNNAYKDLVIYEIEESKEYAVEFDLWEDNEPGDLTLQCEVYVGDDGGINLSINDIHVL